MMSRHNLGVVVHAKDDLRVEELPEPVAGPGEVVLDVAYGGICGSDLHYYHRGGVGDFLLREPMLLGHEVVGTISALGEGAVLARGVHLTIGLAVAVHPASPCGTCEQCRHGLANICPNTTYLGSAARFPHVQGGFARRVLVRADQLVPLPKEVDLRRAAVAEPLAVALHALKRGGGVEGRRLLVTGAGPIGCLVVAAARHLGAAEIVATDLTDKALEVARLVGATSTLRIGDDGASWPEPFDLAVEASGSAAGLASCLDHVQRGGTVVQLGLLPPGETPIQGNALVTREIELKGAFRFTNEIETAVQLLADGLDVDAVISHILPATDAVVAFGLASDRLVSSKVLLDFR